MDNGASKKNSGSATVRFGPKGLGSLAQVLTWVARLITRPV